MPFFLYPPPGSSSSLREAEYVKRKKEGEEADVELEEEGKGRRNLDRGKHR